MKPEHLKLLADKDWRLNNLYWITDKEGKPTRFRMTPEQREYFEGIHTRNIILKARQLGFTTEVCIIQLDAALFESAKCALIAHTLNDAKRLFREKVKYAYDKLPAEIKAANPAVTTRPVSWSLRRAVLSTSAPHFVAARCVTCMFPSSERYAPSIRIKPVKSSLVRLRRYRQVVSQLSRAPRRAGRVTSSITASGRESAAAGQAVICAGLEVFFFSRWKNPQYAIDPVEPLPARLLEYFAEMEAKHGIVVNERQKAWYYAKEKTLGDDMKREYPTIPAEAFQQSVEGAYYAKQFRWLYTNKRIGQIPDNSHLPVHTFWDIGVGDSTAIWFVREVGEEFHIIDYYENSGEGLRHYMKVLKDRGYEYGEHWGPHDIENREFAADAKSRKELAREGYEIDGRMYSMNFRVVPKAGSIPASSRCVKSLSPAYSMRRSALLASPTSKVTARSGTTSAAAGKISPFMTSHRTAPTAFVTLQWRRTTANRSAQYSSKEHRQ